MPADLASYLAEHYLTADPKPSKKRKRKAGEGAKRSKNKDGAGLLIQDDDDDAAIFAPGTGAHGPDADGSAGAATVAGTSAEFRKSAKSSWKTLGGGGKTSVPVGDSDAAAAADAILASAAAEKAAALAAEDHAPVVDGGDGPAPAKMSDGTHAGLQTAAAVSAQLRRRRAEEKAQYERERAERRAARGGDSSGEEETVFRDATGRRIDVTLQREQKRRAAEEKERAARDALKGDVQMEEARRRRERLEDAALMPLARSKDDEEMNSALKSEQRWNDPMMQFVSEGGKTGASAAANRPGTRRVKGRPVYQGPAPPNRYGIRPGYRWDGVDRGNGFEAERFKAINRRERAKDMEYNWQMDE